MNIILTICVFVAAVIMVLFSIVAFIYGTVRAFSDRRKLFVYSLLVFALSITFAVVLLFFSRGHKEDMDEFGIALLTMLPIAFPLVVWTVFSIGLLDDLIVDIGLLPKSYIEEDEDFTD